jgi:hypothetical protein
MTALRGHNRPTERDLDGVWTGEIYGPFGWESQGIFVFQSGRIIGGDGRQFSTGSYRVSGRSVKAGLTFRHYREPPTLFGEKRGVQHRG